MDGNMVLALVAALSGLTIAIVVAAAVYGVRHGLMATVLRQAEQIRQLQDTVALLSQQQQHTEWCLQSLREANAQITEQLDDLTECLIDIDDHTDFGAQMDDDDEDEDEDDEDEDENTITARAGDTGATGIYRHHDVTDDDNDSDEEMGGNRRFPWRLHFSPPRVLH